MNLITQLLEAYLALR